VAGVFVVQFQLGGRVSQMVRIWHEQYGFTWRLRIALALFALILPVARLALGSTGVNDPGCIPVTLLILLYFGVLTFFGVDGMVIAIRLVERRGAEWALAARMLAFDAVVLCWLVAIPFVYPHLESLWRRT
jgi:hypothetical protein